MPEADKMRFMQKKHPEEESSVPPFLAQSFFPGQEAKLVGNRCCLSRTQMLLLAKSCRQWQKPRAESAFLRPPGSHAPGCQLQMEGFLASLENLRHLSVRLCMQKMSVTDRLLDGS